MNPKRAASQKKVFFLYEGENMGQKKPIL